MPLHTTDDTRDATLVGSVNKSLIVERLRELSDRAAQRRLWESTGEGGTDVSSFTEAACQLFDDSALGAHLVTRTTGLGTAAEEALIALDAALSKVDEHLDPATLIESAEMDRVRHLAAVALQLIGQT